MHSTIFNNEIDTYFPFQVSSSCFALFIETSCSFALRAFLQLALGPVALACIHSIWFSNKLPVAIN